MYLQAVISEKDAKRGEYLNVVISMGYERKGGKDVKFRTNLNEIAGKPSNN